MGSSCCMGIYVSPANQPLNDWTDLYETWYIMTPEPISTAYFINPSHQSVYPPIVARQRIRKMCPSRARQRLDKHVPATTNTRNNRRIVGRFIFFAVRILSKESRRSVLPRTSCLGFGVLTAVSMDSTVCRYVKLCTSDRTQRFVGKYHLHLQGRIVSKARDH
jgi:hypothetical protein